MAKDMIVEKSVIINQPKQMVFDYLKYSKNMNNYSVWNMADPNQKTESTGTDGTIGFIYKWDSKMKNVGAGEQEIVNIIQGEQIEYELRFERPMKNIGYSKFLLSETGDNQTMVIWDFRGPTKFPMSLFTGFFRKILGKDISLSLQNLKTILDSQKQ